MWSGWATRFEEWACLVTCCEPLACQLVFSETSEQLKLLSVLSDLYVNHLWIYQTNDDVQNRPSRFAFSAPIHLSCRERPQHRPWHRPSYAPCRWAHACHGCSGTHHVGREEGHGETPSIRALGNLSAAGAGRGPWGCNMINTWRISTVYPLVIKRGWLENHQSMEVLKGKSSIDSGFSIGTLE